MILGGKLLVDALAAHNVRRIYTVAGESYLPVLDALLDSDIEVITCRQESGASFAAEAHANLTGEPGIVLVTRGPGACNASIGIHTAKQSSTPVIMFSGLIAKAERGREAFQEFDIVEMFGSHTKHGEVIEEIADIPASVARAFEISRNGRPGPVVIGLPEDVVFGKGAAASFPALPIFRVPGRDIKQLINALDGAQRPLIIAGGGLWTDKDCAALEKFAASTKIPVATAFRRQDMFDNDHPNYIGELGFSANPALVKRVQAADVVLIFGARLNDTTTQGYTLFKPGQTLIHVYPDKSAFGKSCEPSIAIEAHAQTLLPELEKFKPSNDWSSWRKEARADYETWTSFPPDVKWNGANMHEIFHHLRGVLPGDAIVTTDAGNFTGWVYRYLRYKRPMRLLAPVSGAMGYGVPSAIAAALEYPEKLVLGFCGDGGFMMTGQELATAMHHKAKPIIIVCNNNMYGTIRMHQEREYPGRISGTALTNPDFAKLAQSYGAFGAVVTDAKQFPDVFLQARAAGTIALIEIRMDPHQLTTNAKP